jgi:hypothetical protein
MATTISNPPVDSTTIGDNPPREITFRRVHADRVKEACAKEGGDTKPDRQNMKHLRAPP